MTIITINGVPIEINLTPEQLHGASFSITAQGLSVSFTDVPQKFVKTEEPSAPPEENGGEEEASEENPTEEGNEEASEENPTEEGNEEPANPWSGYAFGPTYDMMIID